MYFPNTDLLELYMRNRHYRLTREGNKSFLTRFLMLWLFISFGGTLVIMPGNLPASTQGQAEIARGEVYKVVELEFAGPSLEPGDTPARDVDLWVKFRHTESGVEYKVYGFWDGDGNGGSSGNSFKVRFCPTRPGRWTLRQVYSNTEELRGQQEGTYISAEPARHPGFWIVDSASAGNRWYKRSDGSHQYIIGNTHYSFLSGYKQGGAPSGNSIKSDITGNAEYFKKLRFGLSGDYYPHPEVKPFLDSLGNPTDWGDFSHRPNPAWFHNRVDAAVQTGYEHDLVADMILAGPDTEQSRSTLRALYNNGDPTPFLKYIAARYGSYPNVWICLCNEYDIRTPSYSETEIAQFGRILRGFLAYPIPVSVHSTPSKHWPAGFDRLTGWYDHHIIQHKLRNLPASADVLYSVWQNPDGAGNRCRPTINDELSYQGQGDDHHEEDTIESHLGAFLGGGYATTGYKPGSKLGHYFWGGFNPGEHTAADNLRWLRHIIDTETTFWKMAPDHSIYSNLHEDFRGMAWIGHEYVLGTNQAHKDIVTHLPGGRWTVIQYDVISMTEQIIARDVTGRFSFDAPESRAVLFLFTRRSEQ